MVAPVSKGLDNAGSAASAITVGASPFVYQNLNGAPVTVLIAVGTVSAIDISRDGTIFMQAGLVAGQFRLSPNDKIRITYAVAPTMNLVPT